MPVDPYTGELLPYGPYNGPWPPDPSWDEDPILAAPPILPPPDQAPPLAVQPGELVVTPAPEAPEAAQARAMADAVMADQAVDPGTVKLGMPRPVPDDAELITAYEEPEPGELTWTAPPDVQDIDLSELDAGDIDAISGGELPPPESLGAPAPALLTNPKNREQAELEAEQKRIASMSPEQLQLEQLMADQAAENEAATKRLEASAADRARAEENEAIYRKAVAGAQARRAEIDAEATRLAEEKVDPDGWRNSRTLFQTIAMYVAGVVGGLVQSRQGGPNVGLQIINDHIERHIAAQRENLAHRRSMLGEKRAALGEDLARADFDLKTEEAFRAAAFQRVLGDIEAEKAQFDPNGTRFRKLTMFQQQMRQASIAAQQAAYEADLKRQMEIGRYDMEVQKHNSQLQKDAAQIAKLQRAGAGGASASKLKQDPRVLAKRYGVDQKFVEGLGPMTEAEFGDVLENAFKGKRAMEPSKGEEIAHNRLITGPQGVLKNKDNREDWVTGDPEETRVKLNAANTIVDLLDEADAIRSRVGGESSWGNSDDFQRLETIGKELIIARKAGTQGMSSDADMQNIATAIGAKDLTSFRSQAARMKQARSMTIREINGWLTHHGYDGQPIKIRNKYKGAGKSADESMLSEMIGYDAKGQSVPTAVVASPLGALARAGEALVRDEDSNIPERYQRELDQAAEDAVSDDANARRAARNRLLQLRDRAKSGVMRKAADAALTAARAAKMPKPGEKGFSISKVQEAMEAELADENANEEED